MTTRSTFLAVTTVAFAVYVATLYPSIPGGDAGELVTAAVTGGVAHPPGYPLFTMLTRAWAAIVPFGSIAWRANLLTALFAAAAAGALAAAVHQATASRWAGVAAAALFAFAPTSWEYAIGAEVFALNSLLVALLAWLAVRYLQHGSSRDAMLASFVFGLGMANHHTILFVGLPLFVMLLVREPRRWLSPRSVGSLVGAFGLGLTPYLYLVVASRNPSLATWGDQRTMTGFLTHLARREYGTLRLGGAGYSNDLDFTAQLALFARFEFRELLWIGAPLALVGAWVGLQERRLRPLVLAIVIGLVGYVIVFHALANLPIGNPLFLRVQERFWLMPALLLCLLAGLAFASIAPRSQRMAAAAALVVAAAQLGLHLREANRRGAGEFLHYGSELLRPLPPRALLLVRGDLLVNTAQYAQLVEGVRPDVRIVDLERLTYPWMRRVLAQRLPDVRFPGERLAPAAVPGGFSLSQLVAANAPRHRIFFAGNLAPQEADVASAFTQWPTGMSVELVPAGAPRDVEAWRRESAAALPVTDVPAARARAPGSWSRVVFLDQLGAAHTRAVRLLELGIARGDEQLLAAAANALGAITAAHPDDLPLAWRNLGLAYAHLASRAPAYDAPMRAAWQQYLERGDPADPQMAQVRALLAQPAPRR